MRKTFLLLLGGFATLSFRLIDALGLFSLALKVYEKLANPHPPSPETD